jgi:hypothetical protein
MMIETLRSLFSSSLRLARLHQLKSEFEGYWPSSDREKLPDSVAALAAADDAALPSCDILLSAEMEIVRRFPAPALRLRHGNLRDEFAALAGANYAAAYLNRLADPANCSDEVVLAEVLDLLTLVQRLRTLRRGFNLTRTLVAALGTAAAIIFLLIIVDYFRTATDRPVQGAPFATTMILLSGMLGGCISALSRLFSVPWSPELVTGVESRTHVFFGLLLNFVGSILVGGVFAMLLYLAFMGKFISGSLFPVFRPEPVADMGLFHQYLERGLVTHADFAKAMVWGFLAGFSERLVPDFLQTLGPRLKVSGTR